MAFNYLSVRKVEALNFAVGNQIESLPDQGLKPLFVHLLPIQGAELLEVELRDGPQALNATKMRVIT